MCGAIHNVTDFPLLEPLLSMADYSEADIREIINKRELRPTDPVIGLVPTRDGARIMPATWWLKLDPESLKPDTRWNTFNCRSSQILKSKLHSIPPRSYRSVVLAEGFFEWQPIFPGGRLFSDLSPAEQEKPPKPIAKQRHLIHAPGRLMLLGAMCKHWLDDNDQPKVSTGIITLPPHPAMLDVHAKSFPLLLQETELESWLNPAIPHEAFKDLFDLREVRMNLEVQAVNDQEFAALDDEPLLLKAPG